MSVHHVVLLRRRSDVDADPGHEADLVRRLRELGDTVPGVERWRVASDEHRRPLSWDHLLDADLADDEAVAAYLDHPGHQALLPELLARFELAVLDHRTDQEDR